MGAVRKRELGDLFDELCRELPVQVLGERRVNVLDLRAYLVVKAHHHYEVHSLQSALSGPLNLHSSLGLLLFLLHLG